VRSRSHRDRGAFNEDNLAADNVELCEPTSLEPFAFKVQATRRKLLQFCIRANPPELRNASRGTDGHEKMHRYLAFPSASDSLTHQTKEKGSFYK